MTALSKRKSPVSVSKIIVYLVLIVWSLTTIYPFIWVIMNSFKKNAYIQQSSFTLPVGKRFTMQNFQTAFERIDIGSAYLNSLLISIAVTILVIILAGLSAFALARYQFRGKKILESLIVASMMFPVFATIIPVFRMEYRWGIVNNDNNLISLLSVILPQVAGNLSFAIIVLRGYIQGLPIELEESAFLEGCNVVQIFTKIILPVAKPSFATVSIFTFLWSYNDLFTQMFFLDRPGTRTITLLLSQITSQAGTNYGFMNASVILVVIPVLIIYILLQKNIIKGMTIGAVKG
ncbi:carbohydrate ABC transporter permease [Caproiciproducens galactitolivorans]|uniref:L-arabinose transport system permease protein AraQ n=1 Tax=Caproiciproducens galactitolivorans TaxID=642589 RepID=A0A4Z0Y8Q4_9FIRM|nr:carbohydrate ABC transporter permease [Caproiciproducens galactitolivorans]QEY34814.1 carbohydrate ABC transporter permease [Caproiciproducens galactitolivorans]TGJ75935.1 L-arabinose transport system permease protein AraQ [Caproiciproducens galactitolivorans]